MTIAREAIIFDLDGTLWDTCETCAIAWNNVVHRYQIKFREIVADDVRSVTGLPHERCIRETFRGLSESELLKLIEGTETEDNVMVAELGGNLYDGVEAGLARLAKQVPLFIVSNCQSGYIETFLRKFRFESCFKDIECWGNTKQAKPQNLAAIMKRNGLNSCVFVGDTTGDQAAANACGVPFWFVSYGFGTCDDADQSFGSFSELVDHALGRL
jgi:phosphoglycolate phosphatase